MMTNRERRKYKREAGLRGGSGQSRLQEKLTRHDNIKSHDRFAACQERRREEKGTGRCGSGRVHPHVGEEGREGI